MKKVKVFLSIGYPSATYEDDFEVEDNTSEKDIAELAEEMINERIDWGYDVVEEESK